MPYSFNHTVDVCVRVCLRISAACIFGVVSQYAHVVCSGLVTPILSISYTAARHSQRIPTCNKSCNSERRHKVRLRAGVPLFALASSIMHP